MLQARTIASSVTVIGLLGVLAACASSQGKIGDTKFVRTPEGVTVDVVLKEYEIDMPDSIPAGLVTFKVHNLGHHEHTLRIEGPNLDKKIEPNLKGGESGELQLTLTPGKYKMTCPVGPHATMGMRRTLTVTSGQRPTP